MNQINQEDAVPDVDQTAEPIRNFLNPRQRKLFEALKEKGEGLSVMFLGAICAFQKTDNPEYLVQAGHSIRELMEKLPRYIDVPTANNFPIKLKVNQVLPSWKKAESSINKLLDPKSQENNIDSKIKIFLRKMKLFFKDYENYSPSKKQETADTLTALDASEMRMPETLMELDCDKWAKINQYFQGISHHQRETKNAEFEQWLDSFERFLVDRMIPQTFVVHDELDIIIAEAEK